MSKSIIKWGKRYINLDAIAEIIPDTSLVYFRDGTNENKQGYHLSGVRIFVHEGSKQYGMITEYIQTKRLDPPS